MKKTVFFGGTFNPPHNAHLLMLKSVAELDFVDKVLVVPTNIPPHKSIEGYCADGVHRLNMCSAMCEGMDKAVVSDIELKREGKSYSFDTLTELRKTYDNLMLLIGGDMLAEFTTWYNYEGILKLAGILAVRRIGVDNEEFDSAVSSLRKMGGTVIVLDTKVPDISSTEIRNEALLNGEELKGLVPKKVFNYIKENGLYPSETK